MRFATYDAGMQSRHGTKHEASLKRLSVHLRNKLLIGNDFLRKKPGGRGEIRTLDRVTPMPPFQGGDLNRSSTLPLGGEL